MTRNGIILGIGTALAVAGIAGAAWAQAEDGAIAAARGAGEIGEQSDGYLGFTGAPSASLKQAVDAVNIKRRAIYTDIAAKTNATVQEVATARACDQFAKRVQAGQKYKLGASWETKGAGPIALPAVCG